MYEGMDMSALVGRKILGLWVSDDEHILAFSTNLGLIAYYADADCCSESWFADITGVKALLGHVVTAAEVIDMETVGYNVNDGRSRQDHDEVYGFKLTTDKGVADIIFRNSSNGYYGGSLALWSPLRDSNGEDPDPKGVQIVDDWQAGAKPAEAA